MELCIQFFRERTFTFHDIRLFHSMSVLLFIFFETGSYCVALMCLKLRGLETGLELTMYVAQDSLRHREIFLPLPPSTGVKIMYHHY